MEVSKIESQLRRAFEGRAWHGPSLLELLGDVTAERAAARLIPNAHSIWELVLHIAAWEEAVSRRLAGDRVELTTEEDWPPVTDTSESAWAATLEHLKKTNLKLRADILNLTDERLSEPIIEGMSSVYGTLHGVIQHNLYHAGQIALLKKA